MHEVYLTSTRDALLVAVPFIVALVLAVFRLDGLFTAPRGPVNRRQRPGCGLDESGEPLVVDPDGKPSAVRPTRKKTADASS
jgi:hypothetical protein